MLDLAMAARATVAAMTTDLGIGFAGSDTALWLGGDAAAEGDEGEGE